MLHTVSVGALPFLILAPGVPEDSGKYPWELRCEHKGHSRGYGLHADITSHLGPRHTHLRFVETVQSCKALRGVPVGLAMFPELFCRRVIPSFYQKCL